MPKVGILTGGGDCAGLNAVIASIVKTGSDEGYEYYGFIKGFEGLLDGEYKQLTPNIVKGITHLGGTILHTTNKGRFTSKKGAGEVNKVPLEILQQARKTYDELGLEALIVIGGDGSLGNALQMANEVGINLVGVPKTIDNDLNSTDRTFGFSTAVDIVRDAMDKIHTTAVSHNRVFFVETFGRNAGWIALYGGVAGGADMILIPEFKFNYENIIDKLRERRNQSRDYAVIAVAEGATAVAETQTIQRENSGSENLLGGISAKIMYKIEQMTGGEFEMRNTVLGHIQRGGSPNADDRILAQRFGVAAMQCVRNKDFGKMVTLRGNEVTTVPLAEAVNQIKHVTAEDSMVKVAKEIGISFAD